MDTCRAHAGGQLRKRAPFDLLQRQALLIVAHPAHLPSNLVATRCKGDMLKCRFECVANCLILFRETYHFYNGAPYINGVDCLVSDCAS